MEKSKAVAGAGAWVIAAALQVIPQAWPAVLPPHPLAVAAFVFAGAVLFAYAAFGPKGQMGPSKAQEARDVSGKMFQAETLNYHEAPQSAPPIVSTQAPPRKLPVLELKFSQGTMELSNELIHFCESGGRRCYLINVHNMPAALDGEVAFRADSISARITFDHAGEKTSFVDRACWVGKVENQIFLHPGDTEHVLLGVADKEWWITYANPNRYASDGWPSRSQELREIRFPILGGTPIPGEITIIANQANRATTLAVRKFVITASNDCFLVNIRWQGES